MGDRLFKLALAVIFVALVVELLVLVRQNRELKHELADLHAQSSDATTVVAGLQAGAQLDPLELRSLDGEATRVDFTEDTVLSVFSPHCPACRANMKNWKHLENTVKNSVFRYVSTGPADASEAYAREYELRDVLLSDVETLAPLKITHTPTTIVIAPGGVVKKVWVGVLPDDALAQL